MSDVKIDMNMLSLQNLETLSTKDLMGLSDDYGLDIPENLGRRFIIGELLDLAKEYSVEEEPEKTEMFTELDGDNIERSFELPESYNETFIGSILRNPAWAFVWWDFCETDLKELEDDEDFNSILIRVAFFEEMPLSNGDALPDESFDVNVPLDLRHQYIMIPSDKKFLRLDLAATFKSKKPEFFKSSNIIPIPYVCEAVCDVVPGKKIKINEVSRLSGMQDLLHSHYLNHRQSFS